MVFFLRLRRIPAGFRLRGTASTSRHKPLCPPPADPTKKILIYELETSYHNQLSVDGHLIKNSGQRVRIRMLEKIINPLGGSGF